MLGTRPTHRMRSRAMTSSAARGAKRSSMCSVPPLSKVRSESHCPNAKVSCSTSKVAPLVGDVTMMGPWDNFAH